MPGSRPSSTMSPSSPRSSTRSSCRPLSRFEAGAREAYRRLGFDFSEDIAPQFRTLIPSDMGAHNALRAADGRLHFLDFEYFGWDDPLTSIANFIMHPGMRLSERQKALYQHALLGHFGRHAETDRLPALMPLYGLRWCAIILASSCRSAGSTVSTAMPRWAPGRGPPRADRQGAGAGVADGSLGARACGPLMIMMRARARAPYTAENRFMLSFSTKVARR